MSAGQEEGAQGTARSGRRLLIVSTGNRTDWSLFDSKYRAYMPLCICSLHNAVVLMPRSSWLIVDHFIIIQSMLIYSFQIGLIYIMMWFFQFNQCSCFRNSKNASDLMTCFILNMNANEFVYKMANIDSW